VCCLGTQALSYRGGVFRRLQENYDVVYNRIHLGADDEFVLVQFYGFSP